MLHRRENMIESIYSKCLQLEPINDQPTGCRIWQGRTDGNINPDLAYGRTEVCGQTVAPHIVIATCCHGFIPRGYHVDHKCNNRLCCEETHLQVITIKRNQVLRVLRKQLLETLGYVPFEVKMNTLSKASAKRSAVKRRRTIKQRNNVIQLRNIVTDKGMLETLKVNGLIPKS